MNFSLCRRPWLRTARFLDQQYERQNRLPAPPDLPEEHWERVQQLQHRLRLAHQRHYAAAQAQLRPPLAQALRRLATDCLQHAEALERLSESPTLRLLHDELLSLQEEFDHVEIDWSAKTLSVQTERIVLEDIDLGPFEIRLSLDQLGHHQPYTVIALDPCRPGCADDITHPHVQSDALCEGEGRHPLAKSLEQGRLGEFFLLVTQILRTYNPGSAYLRMTDWWAASCEDCGHAVGEEDQYECHRCQSLLCDGCTRSCTACDDTLCSACSTTCEACQCSTCSDCLRSCDACSDSVCSGCLHDDLCPTCYEHSLETNDEEPDCEEPAPPETLLEPPAFTPTPPQTTTAAADAAVQPHCLGEAAVPA